MELHLNNIGHKYNNLDVLKEISFSIRQGEIACIIGPSGCGKSTLLRIMGGLETATCGDVYISGEIPSNTINPLTFVFQDFALLPWRSVEANISLVLEDHPIPTVQRKEIIDSVLARTKLSDFKKALPKQLSGGMKQRVAIARALAVNPAFMLLDEPLSALDSQTRELLMSDLIDLWQRENFTACYVTHNLNEAVRLGHKIIVLSRRPGTIRRIVEIPIPLEERHNHLAELEYSQQVLWNLMRDEALAADRELSNAD
ncbi:ABC transporter ATP-binding protein [Polycladidibacter stylochi]|uniref:ABC transporter ATP-binding protein n=1 Tax=Polycladidibacter stylochi TaxID=1807766 RepID=UPI000835DBBB|nr:ABC transporter ATP-binding protein [Pseudovibrio stylochi]